MVSRVPKGWSEGLGIFILKYMRGELKVNDKQRMWLELITTTNLLWLKRRYDPETIQRIMTILSIGEYDYFDQIMLNDIREEWIKDWKY